MAAITTLPCEIIAAILRHLGDISSLPPSLLACRHIYASYKENPALGADILRGQIGPDLLPYAVAALEASRFDQPAEADVCNLLETLCLRPSQLERRLRATPLPILGEMGRLHDVIQSLAIDFASNAWTLIAKDEELPVSGSLSLSPSEISRFGRAFYRAELYFRLFRRDPSSSVDLKITDNEKEWFFLRYPPWENEQLSCALDFLELKFARASHDVIAHDVWFGELEIDYLTAGDNYQRQSWISQGVEFVWKLANEPSYDAKKEMLESTFTSPIGDLYDTMVNLIEDSFDDQVPLSEYTEEELAHLYPTRCVRDTDEGPFEAWRAAFWNLPKGRWAMLSENDGLRERAYVLWDAERLEGSGLLEDVIPDAPEGSMLRDEVQGFESMQASFAQRSLIFRNGGRGYWSEGDASRITWPEEPAKG